MNERGAICINTDGPSSLNYHNSYDSMKISGASISFDDFSTFFFVHSQTNHSMFVTPIGKSVESIVISCPFGFIKGAISFDLPSDI